ncbi:MAG: hypothetical protein ACD_22C00082G0001 [uncultured bacterium]|nr:MAG: hypothetical protein ACD_22C00082G0001 [uncultured bacterium]
MKTKKSNRPEWDNFWFVQALLYSTRGTCDRLRAGCVIVKNKRLVGAGYNGSPSGSPHCDDIGHLIIENHCERTLHSEENAILNSERANLVDATAYVTATPCIRCAKILVNAGVKEVKYLVEYKNSRGKEYIDQLSKETGVKFKHCKLDPRKLLNQAIERLEGPGGALESK